MLVRFIIDNFLSFGRETEFNMLPGDFKIHKDHIYPGKVELLKTATIYGANASGKSNFIKAVHLFVDLILGIRDFAAIFADINSHKFQLSDREKDKITIEAEFLINDQLYYYSLQFDEEGISKEELYTRSSPTANDRMIFIRKTTGGKSKVEVAPKYKRKKEQQFVIQVFQNNMLIPYDTFLKVFYGQNTKEINVLYEWIKNNLFVERFATSMKMLIKDFIKEKEFFNFVNYVISKIDAGIERLDFEEYDFEDFFGAEQSKLKKAILFKLKHGNVFVEPDKIVVKTKNQVKVYKIVTVHKKTDGSQLKFELSQESDGTIRFLSLLPMVYVLKNKPVVLFIDEIGRSIHPALLQKLIEFIMNEPTKGQLIFTTHETHLLDLKIFRQDEIWFTEKDENGSTRIYSLAEFKPRYDKDIRRGYLHGRYGAVPFLSGFEHENLFSNEGE